MSRRKRITATIKMTLTDDSDLIDWWRSIPLGSRNAALKDILREHLAREGRYYRPRQNPVTAAMMPTLDPGQWAQLRDDAAWIRGALHDMPAYLEQLLAQAAALQPIGAMTTAAATPSPAHDTPTLNDAESQRRARKLARVSW